jgi:hypothetical protein
MQLTSPRHKHTKIMTPLTFKQIRISTLRQQLHVVDAALSLISVIITRTAILALVHVDAIIIDLIVITSILILLILLILVL